ncbi:MAG: type II toxin-antitoxin system HicB family antitoxin [Methanolobus sp.]|nr:type II toxin-antitoxin system HicB family antitoxin [Methanolobus sp.]
MKYKFSATIHKEEDWYVSWCPELDVASQGKTVEEALVNLSLISVTIPPFSA